MTWRIEQGDCLDVLRSMDAESVQTCVTSPPYWGLRDYGTATWEGGDPECDHAQGRPGAGRADGVVDERAQRNRDGAGAMGGDCRRCGARRIDSQLGLEPTPEQYVENLVAVFREVRRVLRDDGTVWLNLGDSYARDAGTVKQNHALKTGFVASDRVYQDEPQLARTRLRASNLKPKDLVGIPWMVAFALRADGWYLRSDIIWAKPNPMPESVTDRPTKAHEYLFLLTKSPRYFYDADAIRDGWTDERNGGAGTRSPYVDGAERGGGGDNGLGPPPSVSGRNRRSVWTVTTQPFPGAHFATFPPKLIEPCIFAGSPPKCCGECGAPWERVTESEAAALRDTHLGRERERNIGGRRDGYTQLPAGGVVSGRRETRGWKASCYHPDSPAPDDSGRPVVLDPFAGAGTTGVVALRHDRSFVGIELNPDYAEMARNRIRDDAPLLNVGLEAA